VTVNAGARAFVAFVSLGALAGCGALPSSCPQVGKDEALRIAVTRAMGRWEDVISGGAATFLKQQSADCCRVEQPSRTLLERLFEQPKVRTEHRVVVDLDFEDHGRAAHMYADVSLNSCGDIISYKGFES